MDNDRFKLFVGGIARETSEEALRQHFSKYGVVLGAFVAKEKVTGQSRGFGFVRFANDYDVVKALRDTHSILGRPVDVKKAIPKHEHLNYQQPQLQLHYGEVLQNNNGRNEMSNNGNNYRTKKLFVGGLSSNTTEEEFKSYFEKFGKTIDVVVMHDSITNKPRGFGFVTFDSEDSVEIVMQSNFHELSDKRVEVKRAIPKEDIQSNNNNHNFPQAPTYNSFQATHYVPPSNGFGMLVQYPPVFGYHNNVQGFHFPYGYPLTAQGPNVHWNNQITPPAGFYCPPIDTSCYLPYMNGFDLVGMSIAGYNAAAWTVAGAIIPRLENGNMGKQLQNGTYR